MSTGLYKLAYSVAWGNRSQQRQNANGNGVQAPQPTGTYNGPALSTSSLALGKANVPGTAQSDAAIPSNAQQYANNFQGLARAHAAQDYLNQAAGMGKVVDTGNGVLAFDQNSSVAGDALNRQKREFFAMYDKMHGTPTRRIAEPTGRLWGRPGTWLNPDSRRQETQAKYDRWYSAKTKRHQDARNKAWEEYRRTGQFNGSGVAGMNTLDPSKLGTNWTVGKDGKWQDSKTNAQLVDARGNLTQAGRIEMQRQNYHRMMDPMMSKYKIYEGSALHNGLRDAYASSANASIGGKLSPEQIRRNFMSNPHVQELRRRMIAGGMNDAEADWRLNAMAANNY